MIFKKELLFLKKKKQKDFWSLRVVAMKVPQPAVSKSFLVTFFQKSNCFLPPSLGAMST